MSFEIFISSAVLRDNKFHFRRYKDESKSPFSANTGSKWRSTEGILVRINLCSDRFISFLKKEEILVGLIYRE